MAYPSNYTSSQVEILGEPGVARQLTAGSSSANTALTSDVRRISIRAVGADIRFKIGLGSQTADGNTSHFIANGERLDFATPPSANIGYIRDGSVNGTLEVTELI
tara:strand:+ start:460 stop:774 length:315 start_codon:yes stop_codon:yes gene_type:complete